MQTQLKILMLEDSDTDAMFLEHELKRGGLNFELIRTENRPDFVQQLQAYNADIILSDFNLPGFSGLEAYALVQQIKPATPFILVTGTLSDEIAVECIKAGVSDYIVKDRPVRLPSAIIAALEKRKTQMEKEAAEENIRQNQKYFRFLVENASDLVAAVDLNGNFSFVNPAATSVLGYERESLVGQRLLNLVHPQDQAKAEYLLRAGQAEGGQMAELRLKTKGGSWRFMEISCAFYSSAVSGVPCPVIYAKDITDKKAAEERLRQEQQEKEKWKEEAEGLRQQQRAGYAKDYLFLPSRPMQEIYSRLEQIGGQAEISLLIGGETGTGKEHIARLAHLFSARASKPFVELHCAALPETLLESELFGYEAGAFTDARKQKIGLLEAAQGGSIFLDEVGEMPLNTQTKLLKVLEQKTLRRLGGVQELKLDVRVIAATNRDLQKEAAQGRFRSDLYYRLSVFPLSIPPLRSRPEDIGALSQFFFQEACKNFGKTLKPLSQEVLTYLQGLPWHGNVRELRNIVHRVVLLAANGSLGVQDFAAQQPNLEPAHGQETAGASQALGGRLSREDGEKLVVQNALQQAQGNRSEAARILGVTRQTLLTKIRKYGLDKPE